jgi:hypothetical protein
MEKLFTPNKWFVLFCALFIVVFATLRWVVDTRVQSTAKAVGEDIYSWVWRDKNVCSTADMTEARILKRDENQAVVEVSGEQTLAPFDGSEKSEVKACKSPCKVTLTFYKLQNDWRLGRVELQ